MKHVWRNNKKFNGKKEKRPPPRRFTNEYILEQLNRVPYKLSGEHDKYGGDKSKKWK